MKDNTASIENFMLDIVILASTTLAEALATSLLTFAIRGFVLTKGLLLVPVGVSLMIIGFIFENIFSVEAFLPAWKEKIWDAIFESTFVESLTWSAWTVLVVVFKPNSIAAYAASAAFLAVLTHWHHRRQAKFFVTEGTEKNISKVLLGIATIIESLIGALLLQPAMLGHSSLSFNQVFLYSYLAFLLEHLFAGISRNLSLNK